MVSDNDASAENRKHYFLATNLTYSEPLNSNIVDKKIKTGCGQAFCVHPNGSVVTNFAFSENMKGVARLHLVANDSAGSSTSLLKVTKVHFFFFYLFFCRLLLYYYLAQICFSNRLSSVVCPYVFNFSHRLLQSHCSISTKLGTNILG